MEANKPTVCGRCGGIGLTMGVVCGCCGEPPLAPAPCSATHVGLWIQSRKGNVAHIYADPKMAKETMDALGAMIDAAVEAHAKGELKPKCG